ncbi:ATP-binding protein [Aquabacterium sp. OR-4]|uniref:ATP-binding protein n=1 Tax=Aquabacterium sp. OR-4 TaxID=2978127 RepID=UPI0028C8E5E2|nr:ATP-binding protein [Aquabacterium sp. OR-4]MDT7836811.1 ATP-binding protein [Aquabacterium sp. OR-4]
MNTPRLSPWFGIVGLALLATLLAAAFVQARQFALLNLTVQYQDDYLVLNLYQVETEYLRLREQWQKPAEQADSTALKLRYDIFLSRVGLLDNERASRLLGSSSQASTALSAIAAFTRRADLYLGDGTRADAISPQAADALLQDLLALDAPIHQLMLEASHRVAMQVTERQEKVRQHNRIGLALTGFLVAMVMLFAGLAMRQMRKLDERHQRLQTLADELRDARIDAEDANAAKSEFLADMSHELRTPLHGLLGMLSLVKDSPRDPRSAEWLGVADDSANHLLRLLDDILDLAKLESGSLRLVPQAVHLPTLLREVQALLLPNAQAKGLALQLEAADGLPAHVQLDPTRVRQVLYNLLANAIKFSDAGAIVLRCGRQAADDGAPRLVFAVADTGIGMDRHTLSQLFRRFGRADDPLARRQAGTGLGLAISRNLARLMGGEIAVRSAPGAGSVFTFHCPLLLSPAAPARPGLLPPAPLRSLSVLVAEDHPVNRLYMAALLERLGHQGRFAENGLEALQAVQAAAEQPFDIVLMDVHMPVMDGVAAIEAIRALPGTAGRTTIVALTADVFADTRERCLRAGVSEVVAKPVSLTGLQALFARLFGTATELPPVPALQVEGGDTVPLLDRQMLRNVRELMGAEQLPGLYGGFFQQVDDASRRMREAMREADAEALRRAAHSVKGAALNLGLSALAEAAATLSRDARQLGAAALALALQRFDETLAATRVLCVSEGLLATSPAATAPAP